MSKLTDWVRNAPDDDLVDVIAGERPAGMPAAPGRDRVSKTETPGSVSCVIAGTWRVSGYHPVAMHVRDSTDDVISVTLSPSAARDLAVNLLLVSDGKDQRGKVEAEDLNLVAGETE